VLSDYKSVLLQDGGDDEPDFDGDDGDDVSDDDIGEKPKKGGRAEDEFALTKMESKKSKKKNKKAMEDDPETIKVGLGCTSEI
jgi:hypothetical protein